MGKVELSGVMGQPIPANLWMESTTALASTCGLLERNLWDAGPMVSRMDTAFTPGHPERNTMESTRMDLSTVMVACNGRMGLPTMAGGKKTGGMEGAFRLPLMEL